MFGEWLSHRRRSADRGCGLINPEHCGMREEACCDVEERDEQSEQFELLFCWGESELKIKLEIDSGHLKKMVEST